MVERIFTAIYKVYGLISDGKERLLYENGDGFKAILTGDALQHAILPELKQKQSNIRLRSIFHGEVFTIDKIRQEYESEIVKKYENGLFLVIKRNSMLEIEPTHFEEYNDFYSAIDGLKYQESEFNDQQTTEKIVTTFFVTNEKNINLQFVFRNVHHQWNNRPFFNYHIEMGSPSAYSSQKIEELYMENTALKFNYIMSREVNINLTHSYVKLLEEKDPFKKYMFASFCLELFINISYKEIYSKIQRKKKGEERFNILANILSNNPLNDIKNFDKYKSLRNSIAHGEKYDPKHLPHQELKEFLEKYMKMHATFIARK